MTLFDILAAIQELATQDETKEKKKKPYKPSLETQEKIKDVLQERYRQSKEIVDAKKEEWQRYWSMYKSQQQARRYDWESNLVMPKIDYIVEIITPQIMNTIFSVNEWIAIKNPNLGSASLKKIQEFFMWVFDKVMNYYLVSHETNKAALIFGTAITKLSMKNGWPYAEYINLEKFFPDPLCNKPGQVDDMRFCFYKFERDIEQLKQMRDSQGNDIYFNLDKLIENKTLAKSTVTTKGITEEPPGELQTQVEEYSQVYEFVEYWGSLPYKIGGEKDWVVVAALNGDTIDTIIRCEPSAFFHTDPQIKETVYHKPFVATLYTINPGEFYGKGCIQPVESLINEQTDLHNLYMDNHKRSVMNILKVRNRSKLTEDDLELKPYGLWYMNDPDDVVVQAFPEVNLNAYSVIHGMLDNEIEKASAATAHVLGVGRSKRETYGEIRTLMSQVNARFALFMQLVDRLTLRPLAFKVLNMLKKIMIEEQTVQTDTATFVFMPQELEQIVDFQFAVTAVDSEFSKYAKQQSIPNFFRNLAELMPFAPEMKLNVQAIVDETARLFDIKNPTEFIQQKEPMIPLRLLPPEMQQAMAQILMAAQQQEQEQEQPGMEGMSTQQEQSMPGEI